MDQINKALRLAADPAFRRTWKERRRLVSLPLRQPGFSILSGRRIEFADARSFLDQYIAIFEKQTLRFECANETAPRIIDGGANIGLTLLYWKSLFPKARIVAFEPDPELCGIARRNATNHGFDDIDLRQSALWMEETTLTFGQEGSDSGRVVASSSFEKKLNVSAIPLLPLLDEHVHFLKLDIEGAEFTVLEGARPGLARVERMFVEYHSFIDRRQELSDLLALLRDAGFRCHLRSAFGSPQPFVQSYEYLGMDNLVEIYAVRD